VLVDLHSHTTVSDGSFTPQEILELAASKRISYFSITDHDSIDAIDQIAKIPKSVKFVTGVEISAEFPKTLHILGYNFDASNHELRTTLTELQNFRAARNKQMIDKMREIGINISLAELKEEAKGEIVGRPHFANLMLKKGYVSFYQEAFDKYLAKGKLLYLDKKRLAPQHAIELIINAGGIPVIAHPYQTQLSEQELEDLIKQLKEFGLQGIEAYYSMHSKEQVEQYLKYAEKYDLLITAGSDFHGINKQHIELGIIVPDKIIQPFLDRIN